MACLLNSCAVKHSAVFSSALHDYSSSQRRHCDSCRRASLGRRAGCTLAQKLVKGGGHLKELNARIHFSFHGEKCRVSSTLPPESAGFIVTLAAAHFTFKLSVVTELHTWVQIWCFLIVFPAFLVHCSSITGDVHVTPSRLET